MRKFDAARTLELIEQEQVRRTHLVPTMMVRMLRLNESARLRDLSSLDIVLHGAAPIAPAVKRQMIEWLGPILVEYWGTSEAGVFTRVDSADWLAHPGTVGRPVPGFEVFAVDDAGTVLPPGGSDDCSATRRTSPNRLPTGMPRRRRPPAISDPGSSPSATWAMSTTRGGSSSPTGPRT